MHHQLDVGKNQDRRPNARETRGWAQDLKKSGAQNGAPFSWLKWAKGERGRFCHSDQDHRGSKQSG